MNTGLIAYFVVTAIYNWKPYSYFLQPPNSNRNISRSIYRLQSIIMHVISFDSHIFSGKLGQKIALSSFYTGDIETKRS